MHSFERSLLLRAFCLAATTGATVMACSTDNSETSATDGGTATEVGVPTGQLSRGALPDATVEPPKVCAKPADCPSGVCNLATLLCAAPTCKDGVKNAVETDAPTRARPSSSTSTASSGCAA